MTTPEEISQNLFNELNKQFNISRNLNKLSKEENLLDSNKREVGYAKDYLKTMINIPWLLSINALAIFMKNIKILYSPIMTRK
jgi:hypothetical protein